MTEPGNTDCDVVVIGGGLAGSTAARDLKDAGLSVILVEARDRLGGRTWYRKLANADRTAEVGGTWILPRHYHAVMREVERYGLELVDSPNPNAYFTRMDDKTLPGGFPLPYDQWYDLEQAVLKIVADARRVDHTRPLSEQNVADLDISWREYVDRLELPSETRHMIDAWPLLNAGADTHEFPALWNMAYLSGLDFSVLSYAQYYVKFAHGTKSLIDALTDGIDVRLSSPVTSVSQTDVDTVTIEIDGGDVLTARSAILASPVNTWTDVSFEPQLSEVKRKWADQGQPGHSFKVWALAEHSETKPLLINAYDPVVQMAFPEYEGPEGDLFACFGVWHGEDVSDPKVIEASLDRVGGTKVTVTSVDYHDWNADPYSKGTWNCFPIGWLSQDQSEMKRREGRLLFAGADVSISMGGLLEGAVLSGGVAAAEAIAFLRAE